MKKAVDIKKVGIMHVAAGLAAKDSGGVKERQFSVAIFFADDTRKTAGEHLMDEIGRLNCAGERADATALAKLTRTFTRKTAAILAARDIANRVGVKLAANVADEVEAAEIAEKPYIDKEVARAKERAAKSAARKAEREAAKIAADEDKILEMAAAIQAKRAAA